MQVFYSSGFVCSLMRYLQYIFSAIYIFLTLQVFRARRALLQFFCTDIFGTLLNATKGKLKDHDGTETETDNTFTINYKLRH